MRGRAWRWQERAGSAFFLALVATAASAAGAVLIIVDAFVLLPLSWFRVGQILILFSVVPAAAFLKPQLVIRMTGGRDATTPVRFILTWFRNHWRKLDESDERQEPLIETTLHEIENTREPANEAFVNEWTSELSEFLRAHEQGSMSTRRRRHEIDSRLAGLRFVDPLARWV